MTRNFSTTAGSLFFFPIYNTWWSLYKLVLILSHISLSSSLHQWFHLTISTFSNHSCFILQVSVLCPLLFTLYIYNSSQLGDLKVFLQISFVRRWHLAVYLFTLHSYKFCSISWITYHQHTFLKELGTNCSSIHQKLNFFFVATKQHLKFSDLTKQDTIFKVQTVHFSFRPSSVWQPCSVYNGVMLLQLLCWFSSYTYTLASLIQVHHKVTPHRTYHSNCTNFKSFRGCFETNITNFYRKEYRGTYWRQNWRDCMFALHVYMFACLHVYIQYWRDCMFTSSNERQQSSNPYWEWRWTHPLGLEYDVELVYCCPRHDSWTAAMFALSSMWMRLCQVESPLQERECCADMVRTFEFVSHFVRFDTVTLLPKQYYYYYSSVEIAWRDKAILFSTIDTVSSNGSQFQALRSSACGRSSNPA